jgi:branched-chain amino acid transport system ATP-binding protein
MNELLECRDVRQSFGGVHALDGVSLVARRSEILGIIGPNGAGKTTLIDILSGFQKPAGGLVLFDGRDVTGWPPPRLTRLGIRRTFQAAGAFWSLTVEEDLRVSGAKDDDFHHGAVIEVFASGGLQLKQRTHTLTSGQRRILSVVRAAVAKPRVLLLLDEPGAGVAASELGSIVRFLRYLCEAGTSLIIVDHNVDLLFSLAHRVLVLDGGRCIAEGPPEAIRRDPKVVAAYLGERAQRGV